MTMDPIVSALQVDITRSRSRLPAPLRGLADVSWNMAWCWLPGAVSLFRDVDAGLWESSNHNPRSVLEQGRPDRMLELAADPDFLARSRALVQRLREYLEAPRSPEGQRVDDRYSGRPVAYFSAEFGIHESLPVYSGGLGILAGDHLKSASDLGVPLVGVGLRYQQGYFQQSLDATGWQTEYYADIPFGILPAGLVLKPDGTPLTVSVPIHNRRVTLQMWGVQVGRVSLLLLDSNRDDNDPIDRWITGHLYGGNRDTRIAQELVLGVGGVRALRALGYQPAAFHMNEGHAAFLSLELLRESLVRGQTWEESLNAVRSQTVFTTHTPVPAGHDAFTHDQVCTFLGDYFQEFQGPAGGADQEKLLALGRKYAKDVYDDFNMTYLAMHSSRSTNGVSELHGAVSREMFQWLWPGKPKDETPIGHVTNGVHAATWIAPLLRQLLDRYLGDGWERRQADPAAWEAVDAIPDAELWDVHCRLKQRLIQSARERVYAFRRTTGEPADYVDAALSMLDPEALTFGFARRVATYKRLGLLLHDPERALGFLNLPGKPVQFVIAGKAHPGDSEAKRLLQYLFGVRRDPRVIRRVAFLVNYGMAVAREMIHGVDVWLNLPRRPLEASGTSGMKAALNGVLNCSILDGWWAEGYNGKNGWAVGETREYQDTTEQDRADAESLYTLMERQIIPLYFDRDETGVPRRWVAMMKENLKSNGPRFNTQRMVAEYVTKIYAP
jgi:starch phosphorylase